MDVTKLIDAGPLGIIVLLVLYFLWYLDRRDKAWQEFTKSQRAEDNGVIRDLIADVKSLAAQLVALRDDFNEHNTWERAKLDELQKPATTRRKSA